MFHESWKIRHCSQDALIIRVSKMVWTVISHSNLEYVLVKFFCPNKSDDKFMNNRLPIFIEIKMKLRAILEGRLYTGRNAHQIWAEWAVWARWQILNGSQFFFHFNEKWLSVDNISLKFINRLVWTKIFYLHIFEIAVMLEIWSRDQILIKHIYYIITYIDVIENKII